MKLWWFIKLVATINLLVLPHALVQRSLWHCLGRATTRICRDHVTSTPVPTIQMDIEGPYLSMERLCCTPHCSCKTVHVVPVDSRPQCSQFTILFKQSCSFVQIYSWLCAEEWLVHNKLLVSCMGTNVIHVASCDAIPRPRQSCGVVPRTLQQWLQGGSVTNISWQGRLCWCPRYI